MAALRTSEPSKQNTRTEAAEYIALELGRLMRMASAHGFTMLPYLIDMAVLEAWREATEPEGDELPIAIQTPPSRGSP